MKTLTGLPCAISLARRSDPPDLGGAILIPVLLVKALSRADASITKESAEYRIRGVDGTVVEGIPVDDSIVEDIELALVELE